MIISDDLLKRILADMRLASADARGYRRMLIHELEASMAAPPAASDMERAIPASVACDHHWVGLDSLCWCTKCGAREGEAGAQDQVREVQELNCEAIELLRGLSVLPDGQSNIFKVADALKTFAARKVAENEAQWAGVETEAFIRGREAGRRLAALESEYGSFDAKVQAEIAEAVAQERERCAKIVETHLVEDFTRRTGQPRGNSEVEAALAAAIRGDATCQQGQPCPDPRRCPDPVGCGQVMATVLIGG